MDLATREDMREVLGWQSDAVVRRILLRPCMAGLRSASFIIEPHFHHWPGINAIPTNAYLVGYWQSEKYFKENENIIRSELEIPEDVKSYLNKKYPFLTENTISIHVRRGDYVRLSNYHPIQSVKYYEDSYDIINDKNVNVIIFSDVFFPNFVFSDFFILANILIVVSPVNIFSNVVFAKIILAVFKLIRGIELNIFSCIRLYFLSFDINIFLMSSAIFLPRIHPMIAPVLYLIFAISSTVYF
jgi:hypothetical protein